MKTQRFIKEILSIIAITVCCVCEVGYGAKLYVWWPEADKQEKTFIEESSKHLGIPFEYIKGGGLKNINIMDEPLACVVSAAYLNSWEDSEVEDLFLKVENNKIKLMIVFEDNSVYQFAHLNQSFNISSAGSRKGFLEFSGNHEFVLRELAGSKIPIISSSKTLSIKIEGRKITDPENVLIWFEEAPGSLEPIMIMKKMGNGRLFFTTINHFLSSYKNITTPSLLPFIIFLENSFGDKCWHRNTNQANFTVDDPWLTEPYGNLNFENLLKEMEKVNFHTSIAFIPWNYDRNKRDVVDLFIRHPERYSIAIHGNNHNGYEFKGYDEIPFLEQEKNIHQALARMEVFKQLTGIQYDRIMIFPHGIAPAKTLFILKNLNFLASVNAQIVPHGSLIMKDYESLLNPAVLRYYSFPLLQRYPPSIEKGIIDLNLFLMKPIIIYTHQDYFANGIDAFNELAKYINAKSLKKIDWVSLGKITENLYMERLRDDGAYGIKLLSNKINLKNETDREKVFYIEEIVTEFDESLEIFIGDDKYTDEIKFLKIAPIILLPGENIAIQIIRKNDDDLKKVSPGKNDIKIWSIRKMSDFRDMYLSRSKIGNMIINLYNKYF